jgi:hypothetical protein
MEFLGGMFLLGFHEYRSQVVDSMYVSGRMGPHYGHCLPMKLDEMFIVLSFQLTPLNFLHSPGCEKKFADMAFIYWLTAWPFCCPIKLKGHYLKN